MKNSEGLGPKLDRSKNYKKAGTNILRCWNDFTLAVGLPGDPIQIDKITKPEDILFRGNPLLLFYG